jgi:hypothetical protein
MKRPLLIYNKKLMEEWHPTKNILDPQTLTEGMRVKVWWICKNGHEWEASVNNRLNGRCCPYCCNKIVCATNCVAFTHPHLLREWHEENKINPNEVVAGNKIKILWKCLSGHVWLSNLSSRTGNKPRNCPYCSGKLITDKNSLKKICPHLENDWHEKNEPIENFSIKSNKIVWWRCANGHEWETSIYNRSSGKNCPYCAGQKVCEDNCLENLYPSIALEWSKRNKFFTSEIHAGSNKIVWWDCQNGHVWKAAVFQRTKNGTNCPYCANQLVCKDNCLETTHPHLLKEWDYVKNIIEPSMVLSGSRKKVWWKCNNGHEWETSIVHRKNGRTCPYCSVSISKASQEWLNSLGIELREKIIKCGSKKYKVDGLDVENNIVYEFFGDFWHGNPKIYKSDDINLVIKKTFGQLYIKTIERINELEKCGYKVVFIWESDWKK